MNFNIESWNIDELKEIFEIDQALTIDVIKKKVNEYITKIQSVYSDDDKDMVIEFVNKACDKLIKYCDKDTYLLTNDINSNNKLENHKLETFDVSYKNGYRNPLRKHSRVLNLSIDSIFRKNYNTTSSTDFVYSLPVNIKDVVSMRVSSIEFPNSVYVITSKNKSNEFTIISYNIGMVGKWKITKHRIILPNGLYKISYLIDYLNNIFSSVSKLKRISAVYNSNNNTINFVNISSTPNIEQFDIDFTIQTEPKRPIQFNLGWILGYRKSYYKYESDIVNNKYIAESPINFLETPYFYLHINDFNHNFSPIYDVIFEESVITSLHILDKIPNTGAKNIIQTNVNNNEKKIRYYNGPVNIKRLEIKLLDKFGRPVDIQKSDFSFTLQLELLYDL